MTIEQIQNICNELPGVTQDIKWEDHLCFNIGNKIFLITSPDRVPPSASFKAGDEDFHNLISGNIFEPAQYLARYKWVSINDIGLINEDQWRYFINQSYKLIASKLSKRFLKEIGFDDVQS